MSTPPTTEPSRAALATLVGLAVVLCGFVLALYGLTAPSERGQVLDRIAGGLPMIVVAVPAVLAWLRGEQLRSAVQRVEHQTNGNLTQRLKESNDTLREELLNHLAPLGPQRVAVEQTDDPATPGNTAQGGPVTSAAGFVGAGGELPRWRQSEAGS